MSASTSRPRWENAPAEGVSPRQLDQEQALRVVDAARTAGRLVGPVGRRLADMLESFETSSDTLARSIDFGQYAKDFNDA